MTKQLLLLIDETSKYTTTSTTPPKEKLEEEVGAQLLQTHKNEICSTLSRAGIHFYFLSLK